MPYSLSANHPDPHDDPFNIGADGVYAPWDRFVRRDEPSRRVLLLVLAGASAAISGVVGMSMPATAAWLPGLVFGLLVVLPWARLSLLGWWRGLWGVAAAVGAHAAAAELMLIDPSGWGFVAGVVGSVIVTLPFWGTRRREVSRALSLVVLVGLAGGPAVALLAEAGVLESDLPAPLAWVLMAWQGPVALMLSTAWWRRVDLMRCRACGRGLLVEMPGACVGCGKATDEAQQRYLARLAEYLRHRDDILAKALIDEAKGDLPDDLHHALTPSGGDRFGELPSRL